MQSKIQTILCAYYRDNDAIEMKGLGLSDSAGETNQWK